MSVRQEPSGFHTQCLTAVLFGLLAIAFYVVASAYLARSDSAGAKLQGLLAATPFAITASSASVIALLIYRGKRIGLLVKVLPLTLFMICVVAALARNAL